MLNCFPRWPHDSTEATFQIKGGVGRGRQRYFEALDAEVSPRHSYVYSSQQAYEIDTTILISQMRNSRLTERSFPKVTHLTNVKVRI